MHIDATVLTIALLICLCAFGFIASILRLTRIERILIRLRQEIGVRRHSGP